jgi:hypothetical protein
MTETPQTLFVVRVRKEPYDSTGRSVESGKPLGMEGAFASRERAESFQAELERRAARSGAPGPLLAIRSLAQLRQASAFEPGVLRDWMIDHGIPDPDTFVRPGQAPEDDHWMKWVRQQQEDDRYLDWLLSLTEQRQRADLYAALHHFHFYEIVEVPFIDGAYPEERWEPWEARARTMPLPTWLSEPAEERREAAAMPGASRKVYVIVRMDFVRDGNWTAFSDDVPVKAFSDRGQAEAYLDRCWRHLRDEEGCVFQFVEMEIPSER